MPKPRFSVNTEVLEVLYNYVTGKLSEEDVHEKVDEIASYRYDVLSSVDAYYRGIEN